MILVTADITGLEARTKALKEAHKAKREFGRVVGEELRKAIVAEMAFKASRSNEAKGLRGAMKQGGPGAIDEQHITPTTYTRTVGVRYSVVPWWRIQDIGGTIRARRVRNLTIPLNDEASNLLYKYGGARNIPNLVLIVLGGKPYLAKESKPDEPIIALRPSVTIKGTRYVSRGLARFRSTAWRRLLETLPPIMVN